MFAIQIIEIFISLFLFAFLPEFFFITFVVQILQIDDHDDIQKKKPQMQTA